MSKGLLAIAFLLAAVLGLEAQEKVGETVYLDGAVSITRDGSALDSSAVVIGASIDNFDQVETGDDGTAQVQVTTTRAATSTITVSPDTQFTFELSALEGKQSSSINLISGSLSLKVSKLNGSQELSIQTESAVLGVRGTEFSVSTSDAGDVLVTCAEGAVACTREDGTEYQAVPGTAVENQEGAAFRTIPVTGSDLEGFRRAWLEQRRAAVQANAGRLIQANAERYLLLRAAYDKDYEALMRQQAIISKWRAEDRKGGMGTNTDVDREKKAVLATLLRLRRAQFLLERVQFRLVRLKRLHDQGYGQGTLPSGATTTQFFDQLMRDRPAVNGHMAAIRNMARLYSLRNGGADPTSYSVMFRERLQQKPAREPLRGLRRPQRTQQ
ncbi:MAG TPA: FecR family protein [Spirochaetia bacterium]|nr:FecR family protein [Spirochaetia bacterium]